MISKIKQAKNLGIFHDCGHEKNVPDFKRYNLVYGWNGSGKTTLSRLFSALPSGSSDKYPDLEYRIDTDDGALSQKKGYSRKVMVFNQEYVAENAPILENSNTSAKHIFILGEEDKKLISQIETDTARKARLSDLLNKDDRKEGVVSLSTQKKDAKDAKDKLFTDTARTIASSRAGRAIRDYRRSNAMKAYEALSTKKILSDEELEKCQSHLRESVLESIGRMVMDQVSITKNGKPEKQDPLTLLEAAVTASNALLKRTVKQELIARLEDNPDIAQWVAAGIPIHERHKSGNCEYCQQVIPSKRAEELAGHFNPAHEGIINNIDEQSAELNNIAQSIRTLSLVDKANFYKQLHSEYEESKRSFDEKREKILGNILALREKLEEKKVKTHQEFVAVDEIDISGFSEQLKTLNALIDKQNDTTVNFSTNAEEAEADLEKHLCEYCL